MQTTIQQFTLSLLTYKGALVEDEGRSANVLLGGETAAALGMNDYERLAFDPSVEEAGTLRVDYDSPSFEAMGRIVGSMGKVAFVTIPPLELRAIDVERELEKTLRLQNGVYRLRDCVPVTQRYFCFFLQYDVMADDRSGGIEEVWVNPATRSIPRIASLLETMETRDDPALPEWSTLLPQAWELALANASRSIEFRLGGFLSSVERRRERDLQRMRDYYQTIDEEIRRKIARVASKGVGGPSDSPTKEAGVGSAKRDEQKAGVHPVGRTVGPTLNKEDARKSEIDRLAATARAYEARAAELQERYRVRVRITGLAALVCAIPTYEIRVQLLRRSARTEASFSWNPFDRKIEPRCCDACRQSTEAAVLCDDRVHYLCLECLKSCPSCSKLFCRACHSRCPRTHR